MLPLMIFASSVAYVTQSWSDRTTISRIDRSYQEAVKRNDAAVMKRILHPRFQLVLGDGRKVSRKQLLDEARSGRIVYELQDEEPNSQSVLVWGDTAVVTAKLLLKGKAAGEPFEHVVWFSDTYVRTASGWRYLFGQASLPLSSDQARAAAAADR